MLLVPQQDVRVTGLHSSSLGVNDRAAAAREAAAIEPGVQGPGPACGQCQRREVFEFGLKLGLGCRA